MLPDNPPVIFFWFLMKTNSISKIMTYPHCDKAIKMKHSETELCIQRY